MNADAMTNLVYRFVSLIAHSKLCLKGLNSQGHQGQANEMMKELNFS